MGNRSPLAALVGGSLAIAAVLAVVGFALVAKLSNEQPTSGACAEYRKGYYFTDDYFCARYEVVDSNAGAKEAARTVTEWSLTYLLFVGVPYGFVLLLDGDRRRRFLHYWLGTKPSKGEK